jgi:hypothetical protein
MWFRRTTDTIILGGWGGAGDYFENESGSQKSTRVFFLKIVTDL